MSEKTEYARDRRLLGSIEASHGKTIASGALFLEELLNGEQRVDGRVKRVRSWLILFLAAHVVPRSRSILQPYGNSSLLSSPPPPSPPTRQGS